MKTGSYVLHHFALSFILKPFLQVMEFFISSPSPHNPFTQYLKKFSLYILASLISSW